MGMGNAAGLWEAAKANPSETLASSRAAQSDCTDPETMAWIIASAARAHFELGENLEAIKAFERALPIAPPALRERAAVSFAAALSADGRTDEARNQLGDLVNSEELAVSALARSQLGMIELHAGDVIGALELLEPAIEVFSKVDGEQDSQARALGNAGYCDLMLGRLDSAIDRFRAASELAKESGQSILLAGCLQNIGYALMRQGDLAGALIELDQARSHYRDIGDPGRNLSTLLDDQAETFRIAGLTADAVRAANEALGLVLGGDNMEKQADAWYRLARCQLDAGDSEATHSAATAAALFEKAGRDRWVRRCNALELEAMVESGQFGSEELVGPFGSDLSSVDWELEERSMRNLLALEHVRRGSKENARLVLGLDGVDAASDARSGDQGVMAEVEHHLSGAIASVIAGDELGRQAEAAAELVRRHTSRLADPEMRAGAARLSNRLRRLFVGDGVDRGDAMQVFNFEESFRSVSLSVPRATPARDARIASVSQEIRDVARSIEETTEPDSDALGRLSDLEEELRRRSFQLQAQVADHAPVRATASGVARRIAGRRLLEWVEVDRMLHLVVCDSEAVTLVCCGSVSEISSRSEVIRSDLARLARPGLSLRAGERRWTDLITDCRALGSMLLPSQIERLGAEAGWILSPPNFLADLPWSLIFEEVACGVALSVVPSASWWLEKDGMEPVPLQFGSLVGPGLPFAAAEARRWSQRFGDRSQIASTAADALAVVSNSTLLHVASHGNFREDSPRFSNLRLDDGPFALHELDRADRVPDAVVLAACDGGRHTSTGDGDLLGFAPSWLAAGSRAVMAPVCAVGDEATGQVVDCFYERMIQLQEVEPPMQAKASRGLNRGLATALASTQADLADAATQVRAAAHSFVLVGCDLNFLYQTD